MLLKTKSGRIVELPSEEEDIQINRGIAADPDTLEWTEEDFRNALRMTDFEQKFSAKVSVTLQCSAEVIEAFKATGEGWQTRVDEALKEWLKARTVQ